MKDFRARIQCRADILNVLLTESQLEFLNTKVNEDIKRGIHEFDALDYAYFYIKNNYI